MSSSNKVKEGDDLIKKAEKALAPGLFKWKPDWDTATPLFEKAAVAYKLGRDYHKAKLAYEKASEAMEKTNSSFLAAKHQESAAAMAREAGCPEEMTMFFRKACDLYCEAGKAETGAQCLGRAAAAAQEKEPEKATELYMEAVEMYESEGREAQAHDTYRAAVQLLLRRGLWAEAAAFLLRFGQACDKAKATSSQCKAYLGAVVVWLYAQDAREAERTCYDLLEVPAFGSSDEGQAAEDLLAAYRSDSVDAIREVIKTVHCFRHGLDTSVARLAAKLPTGDVSKLSADLAGGGDSMGGGGNSAGGGVQDDEEDEEDLC